MTDRDEMFVFLDQLRASGDLNMYGARPYLMKAFGIKETEAAAVLGEWMDEIRRQHHREANAETR